MHAKKIERLRRARKTRERIKRQRVHCLRVYKTARHIYAQVIDISGHVIVSASSLDKEIRKNIAYSGNIEASKLVGKFLGERIKKSGIDRLAFDRSGFKYHGRIKALADSVRELGIQI